MAATLVNGEAYDYVNITFGVLNNPSVAGVGAIKYKLKQEKKLNYFTGKYPVSASEGQVTFEASITLEEKEIRRILNDLGVPDLTQIPPSTVTVAYMVGLDEIVDVLSYVRFTGQGIDVKSGDMGMSQELELSIAGIEFGR